MLGGSDVIEISGELESNIRSTDDNKLLQPKSTSSIMQLPSGLQLSSTSAREWLQSRRQNLKPWLSFVSTTNFSVPTNPQKWTKRVMKNVEYFQSNYMFVFVGLILYCILTSLVLLVAVGAFFGGCYIVSLKNAEKKLVVAGHEITLVHQYIGVAVLSFPIFYLAGATGALFWVIGASFFMVMVHATFYNIDKILGSEDEPFELQMEEV